METKKIAVACFIGGVLCCAVALMFAPVYWWFGLIAGMAGGYISYEFREARKTIPIALRAAGRESVVIWEDAIAQAREWFSEPHPFFYSSAIIAVLMFFLLPPRMDTKEITISQLFVMGALFIEIQIWATICVGLFTFIGMTNQESEAEESQRKLLSYQDFTRWFAKGLGLTILFFVWTLWKYLVIAAWAAIRFFGEFAWHLFKLIHSEKRVLCALDGTLGGATSYIWFASATMSFPEQVVFVVFGGLLGAAFGVANWEIVSKGILRVPASTSA